MAEINLNLSLIRDRKGKDVVSYLNELHQNHSNLAICRSLLEAVDLDGFPQDIFGIFLPWSKSHDTIAIAINEGPSRLIRKQGIKCFSKALADPEQWESMWTEIGKTKGLIDLFAKVSVLELETLSTAIGHCNRGKHKIRSREEAVEDLLHALLPSHYPGSELQTQEKRPVQAHYAKMVTACSPEFVEQLLDAKDASNPLYRRVPIRRLIKTHGELLRKRVIDGKFGDSPEDDHLRICLQAYIYTQPPKPVPGSRVSASMSFAMKVLQLRLGDIDNDKRWPASVSEADALFSLFNRSLKKSLPEARIHDVILLGLQLLEAKTELKSSFKSLGLWSNIIPRWKKDPEIYDDALTLALSLGLGGSQKTICRDFLKTSRSMSAPPELRWPLLRQFCLHAPKHGIDIDTAIDFKPLAKQPWSSDFFSYLSNDQAIKLLKALQDVNPDYSFLERPTQTSILSNQEIMTQRNFNVVLLLTVLQRNSEEIQERAENGVKEFKKKSATSKEQSDRAQYATAASAYAIASGNLDLYGEIVTWQQRYVRDPLTLKVVFGRDAVMTIEGVELLSGIPKPLPPGMTLAQVAASVEKANAILMTFHESIVIARREPSFQQRDWTSVNSLFGMAISERVARAKDLQKSLQDSEIYTYTAIWGGTLSMLEKVSVEFVRQVYEPIKQLLSSLPPKALAATAMAMLAVGKQKREKQNRQPEDDLLENLSYDVLLKLVKSDKPELAQQLVLQTIIDRPDASSWHRQLLSATYLKSVCAKDAQEMLFAFATAIGEKLEEQSYVKVGKTQPTQSAPSQPLVKVTTVKYLAQLLDNAEFISTDAAVEVLVELFQAGTHRDIRLATLDSLLSLLNNLCSGSDETWRSNSLVEKILGALETVIPIVGSINESHPPRLEDWKEARETGILPDISDTTAGMPPLLSAILTASSGYQYPRLKALRAEFITRFLLPILKHSQAEHRKWISLFLAKHKVNISIDELPPTPISWQVWETLVEKYPELTPQLVLEDFNKHIVMTIAPPTMLKDFNKSLKKNPDLRNTPEVQHWLSQFDQKLDQYFSCGTCTLVRMIHHDWPQSSVTNGIVPSRVVDMIIMHASLIIDNYETYTEVWNAFVNDLRHPAKTTYPFEDANSLPPMYSMWQKSGRLVLEKVVALVAEKKEKHAMEHKHIILPSTTKLRLWLLSYPCFPEPAEVESQFKAFSKELDQLLDTFLKGGANVLRWPKIAEDSFTVSQLLNTDEERLRVALYIGELIVSSDGASDQRLSALNFVRVALAMKLIEDGQGGLKKDGKTPLSEQKLNLILRLRDIVMKWQGDSDEDVREKVADWRKEKKNLWNSLTSDKNI